MPYELYNPHVHSIDCSIPRPIGMIRVEPNECLPTPTQEAAHITVDVLQPFVLPSFLHETPPAVRRRLLQDEELEVDKRLVELTQHLPEFGGPDPSDPEAAPVVAAQAPKETVRHVFPDSDKKLGIGTPSIEEDNQALADKVCSSGRVKNVENP